MIIEEKNDIDLVKCQELQDKGKGNRGSKDKTSSFLYRINTTDASINKEVQQTK